jgi:hypothetical protein
MKRVEWANSRVAANNARVWHIAFASRREPHATVENTPPPIISASEWLASGATDPKRRSHAARPRSSHGRFTLEVGPRGRRLWAEAQTPEVRH